MSRDKRPQQTKKKVIMGPTEILVIQKLQTNDSTKIPQQTFTFEFEILKIYYLFSLLLPSEPNT